MRLIDAEVAKEMLVNHAKEFSDVMNRKEKALLIGGGGSCIDKCPTIEVPRWIPVSERLPTAEEADEWGGVLATHKRFRSERTWCWETVRDYPEEFTHWMPIPQPLMTCEDCKFYENECEAHSQMETIGQKRGIEICELFRLPQPPKDGE